MRRLLQALAPARTSAQLLDIVPNHMAIATPHNRWWWDVLENGTVSRYAAYFDVDWDPPEARLREPRAAARPRRPLRPRPREGRAAAGARRAARFVVRYHEHAWPMSPALGGRPPAGGRGGRPLDLRALGEAFARLDADPIADVDALRQRHRDKKVLKARFAVLLRGRPRRRRRRGRGDRAGERRRGRARRAARAAELPPRVLAGRRARPRLPALLRRELAGRAARRGGPRLPGHPRARARLAAARARSTALRVDHPDGLRDPAAYLQRLQDARPGRLGRGGEDPRARRVAARGLAGGRAPPATTSWPASTGLFVDPAGEEAAHASCTASSPASRPTTPSVLSRRSCRSCSDVLGSDVNRLTALLVEVCERHRRHRDYTRHELHDALREVIAAFPVYRTLRARRKARPRRRTSPTSRPRWPRCAQRRPDVDGELLDVPRRRSSPAASRATRSASCSCASSR